MQMYLVGKVNQVSLMRGIRATGVVGFQKVVKTMFLPPYPNLFLARFKKKVKS
jgi:hypothetical protein